MTCVPIDTSDQPGHPPSSLSAWRNIGSLATNRAPSEDSDQTGRMPRLIWVIAGCTGHFVGFDMHWQTCSKTNITRTNEPPHDKTNNVAVHPAKTQISLGIRPVWSEFSLCTQWVAKDPTFLQADSENSDQTGQMPRLIGVFAGRTVIFVGLVMKQLKYTCTYLIEPSFSFLSLFSSSSISLFIWFFSFCSLDSLS